MHTADARGRVLTTFSQTVHLDDALTLPLVLRIFLLRLHVQLQPCSEVLDIFFAHSTPLRNYQGMIYTLHDATRARASPVVSFTSTLVQRVPTEEENPFSLMYIAQTIVPCHQISSELKCLFEANRDS